MKLFDGGDLKMLYHSHGRAEKANKAWEFQVSWMAIIGRRLDFVIDLWSQMFISVNVFSLFSFHILKQWKTDHAGFEIGLKILGLDLEYKYYDTRHWDYDNDKWEEYPEN